jgi:hypothetical protein
MFVLPVTAISIRAIGADGEDFRVTRGEGRNIVAQAREMGAAVWSQKSAQENQDNVFLRVELRQPDNFAVKIGKLEIRSSGEYFHGMISFRKA